jgi:hypothetical protein
MAVTTEVVTEAMFQMVSEYQGKKKLKAMDLTKAMIERFGAEGCDKKMCKAAIRELIDSSRCVYTYFGGSYVELPHEEGAATGGRHVGAPAPPPALRDNWTTTGRQRAAALREG